MNITESIKTKLRSQKQKYAKAPFIPTKNSSAIFKISERPERSSFHIKSIPDSCSCSAVYIRTKTAIIQAILNIKDVGTVT